MELIKYDGLCSSQEIKNIYKNCRRLNNDRWKLVRDEENRDMKTKSLITILLMILFLFPYNCLALSDVTFAWGDPNTPWGDDLDGFKLYQSKDLGDFAIVADITDESVREFTLQDVEDGSYVWRLTAYDESGNESDPSNEVQLNLDSIAPGAPCSLEITIVIKTTIIKP